MAACLAFILAVSNHKEAVMKRFAAMSAGIAVAGVCLVSYGVWAQTPQHHTADRSPMQPGQDAFGAMAEVVRILEADPATDWSKVDMERLRQHLIDMNEVVLHASVKSTQVPGGLAMDITGEGRTARSIRSMVIPQAAQLGGMPVWAAKAESIPDGVRLIVVARDPSDAKTVTRIRGLGFAGLLVQGGHHGPHHLAMAKGEMPPAHKH
jgi:hypothetical protein